MKRREFITLLGGAAAAWPLTARAQQPERMRRIGVLLGTGEDDPEGQARSRPLSMACGIGLGGRPQCPSRRTLGRRRCRRFAIRSGTGRAHAGRYPRRTASTWPLHQATRVCRPCSRSSLDPVGAGFVDSLARPGGKATGFSTFEYAIEWEMAGIAQRDRAGHHARAVLRDSTIAAGIGQFAVVQAMAPLGID